MVYIYAAHGMNVVRADVPITSVVILWGFVGVFSLLIAARAVRVRLHELSYQIDLLQQQNETLGVEVVLLRSCHCTHLAACPHVSELPRFVRPARCDETWEDIHGDGSYWRSADGTEAVAGEPSTEYIRRVRERFSTRRTAEGGIVTFAGASSSGGVRGAKRVARGREEAKSRVSPFSVQPEGQEEAS